MPTNEIDSVHPPTPHNKIDVEFLGGQTLMKFQMPQCTQLQTFKQITVACLFLHCSLANTTNTQQTKKLNHDSQTQDAPVPAAFVDARLNLGS